MTYLSTILADSPDIVWALDETVGTVAADSSGNGNDGTIVGGPTLDDTTLWAGANCPTFAVGDYVSLDTPIALGTEWTIEAWAVRDTSVITGTYSAVIAGDTPSGSLSCRLLQFVSDTYADPDGRLAVSGQGAATFVGTMQANIALGGVDARDTIYTPFDVHHYVLTMSSISRALILYVDGVEVATKSIRPETVQDFASFTLRVASDGSGSGDWVGGIGWVALYPTALSATRVRAHYDAIPHDWTTTDSGALSESVTVAKTLDAVDPFTFTESATKLTFLAQTATDSAALTDTGLLQQNFTATDSALFSDIAPTTIDPHKTTTDRGLFSEHASFIKSGSYPSTSPTATFDFVASPLTSDCMDLAVIYSDDPSVYDFVVTSAPYSDFEVPNG